MDRWTDGGGSGDPKTVHVGPSPCAGGSSVLIQGQGVTSRGVSTHERFLLLSGRGLHREWGVGRDSCFVDTQTSSSCKPN